MNGHRYWSHLGSIWWYAGQMVILFQAVTAVGALIHGKYDEGTLRLMVAAACFFWMDTEDERNLLREQQRDRERLWPR